MTPTPDDGAQAISDHKNCYLCSGFREVTLAVGLSETEDHDCPLLLQERLTAETAAREKAERERDEWKGRFDQFEKLTDGLVASLTIQRDGLSARLVASQRECERLRDANRRHATAHYRRSGDTDSLHAIGEERDEELENAREERDAAIRERDEIQAVFDRQWECDMQAIKRWQEAHPGNDLVWPDRGKLAEWLIAERDAHAATIARLRERLQSLFDIADDVFGLRYKQIDDGDYNEVIIDRWMDQVDDLRTVLADMRAALAANPEAKSTIGATTNIRELCQGTSAAPDPKLQVWNATAQPKESPDAR